MEQRADAGLAGLLVGKQLRGLQRATQGIARESTRAIGACQLTERVGGRPAITAPGEDANEAPQPRCTETRAK